MRGGRGGRLSGFLKENSTSPPHRSDLLFFSLSSVGFAPASPSVVSARLSETMQRASRHHRARAGEVLLRYHRRQREPQASVRSLLPQERSHPSRSEDHGSYREGDGSGRGSPLAPQSVLGLTLRRARC